MSILDKLEAKRHEMQMSNRAFAQYLGISHVQWLATKAGTERFGQKLARGVAAKFPDLATEAALAVVAPETRAALGA